MKKIYSFLIVISLTGCVAPQPEIEVDSTSEQTSLPTSTTFSLNSVALFIDPSVPRSLIERAIFPEGLQIVTNRERANLFLQPVEGNSGITSHWYYVVAGAFPTLEDSISLVDLQERWRVEDPESIQQNPMLATESTLLAISDLWGEPGVNAIQLKESEEMLATAWADPRPLVILPFEDLQSEWKVIWVDGISLFDRQQDLSHYPLQVIFGLSGDILALNVLLEAGFRLPISNFDPEQMTTLLITGTTALVRSTAERMETNGVNYPGEMIQNWLSDADLTHISDEVSFTPVCPTPDPWYINLQFCSRPDYMSLLNYIGADIIELTGNHLMDYGAQAMLASLEYYQQAGFQTYGGGTHAETARSPLLIEDHGNHLALLGCNSAGPDYVWATENSPGAAHCDYEWMVGEIDLLQRQGYVVVVTLQTEESYDVMPMPWVREEFLTVAQAGPAIISGSQAHFPQGFEFIDSTFIHYGLGNLFFDQMDYPVIGTRREFLDRYIIYDGRLISIELLTAYLEDYAQPRPMTEDERRLFLDDYFTTSGW